MEDQQGRSARKQTEDKENDMEPYRIVEEHAAYFMTFSVTEWLPVFVDQKPCQIIVDSLNFCHREMFLRTNAYVIMPTHLHVIGFDAEFDSNRLVRTITALRKFTGRQLCEYCTAHLPVFDHILRAAADSDRERQFWQPTRHPEAIYSQRFWREKVSYLHENPCRKGLVRRPEQWRFSSAAYWAEEQEQSDVILTQLEW
jgi:REP element-mobilizing transposase RayT